VRVSGTTIFKPLGAFVVYTVVPSTSPEMEVVVFASNTCDTSERTVSAVMVLGSVGSGFWVAMSLRPSKMVFAVVRMVAMEGPIGLKGSFLLAIR